MRYLMVAYRTGGGGSPDAPPDPRIAEEASRREAIAFGQADARRRSKYGTYSTVLTRGREGGTALTGDVAFGAGRGNTDPAAPDYVAPDPDPYDLGSENPDRPGALERILGPRAPKKKLTGAESAELEAAIKDKSVGAYISRRRSGSAVQ